MEDYNNLKDDEELEQDQSQRTKQNLGKNQKIAVAVLGVLAVAVIGAWMVQLKKSINSPFSYNPGETNKSTDTCEGPECQESLKTKDTDKDGLTDWDELNIYETSPYLEDSDSDGVFDKEEIEAGKDPNCPIGRDCSSTDLSSGITGGESDLQNQLNLQTATSTLGDTGQLTPTQQQDLQKILQGQSDVSSLRKMLLESGMDEKTLNEISDEDLMASYKEVLGSQ